MSITKRASHVAPVCATAPQGCGVSFEEAVARLQQCSEELLAAHTQRAGVELHGHAVGEHVRQLGDRLKQHYLDGYEISPHPDIRKKALTYMVNINPAADAEQLDFHTHYMRFDPAYSYVQEYWRNNTNTDRRWVPWSWCRTVKQQRANNSMVIFAPTYNTLHAVKADYNHLLTQRTQLYRNFWLHDAPCASAPEWRSYVIREDVMTQAKRRGEKFCRDLTRWAKHLTPRSARVAVKRLLRRDAVALVGQRVRG